MVKVHSKVVERDQERKRAVKVRTKVAGGECRGLACRTVRVPPDEHPWRQHYLGIACMHWRVRMKGVDERAGDVLPNGWATEGGGDVDVAGKRNNGGTDTGAVRFAPGQDRGRSDAASDETHTLTDPERED